MNDDAVLVTGAAGFIGSHLVEELLRRGRTVRAFVRYNSGARTGWLADIPRELRAKLQVFFGDIRDARAVREAVQGCVCVHHLAALIGIPYSYVAPDSYVEVNIQGTLNVLNAARDFAVQRTVVTSTSEVYGTARYTPIDEEHPLQAQSPYSATKIAADHLALSFHAAFGLPVTVVRPFNTYGPRQSTRAVIPTILSQALGCAEIRLGNLSPVRDLVYIADTVSGFLAVADSAACVGRVTNLATGRGISVHELVERILQLVARKLPVIESSERKRPESSEVFELLGSAAAAKRLAGWEAHTPLEEGLEKTLAWVRQHPGLYEAGVYGV